MSRFAYPLLQLLRTPAKTAFFTLLMVLAGTLLCLSMGLYGAAYDVTRNIDSQYTTIAIPDVFAIREANGGYYEVMEDGVKYTSDDIRFLSTLQQDALNTTFAVSDRRGSFMAVAPNISPLLPASTGSWYIEPYNIALFKVKCIDKLKEPPAFDVPSFIFTLQIEQVVMNYQNLIPYSEHAVLTSVYYNEDGTPPFDVGKSYLVLGQYTVFETEGFINFSPIPIKSDITTIDGDQSIIQIPDAETAYSPWLEIPGDMDVFDFIKSNQDAQLLSRICDDTYHSLTVLATDQLYSIFGFANGSARVVQGRSYTKEEATSGKRACVISAGLAALNNLSIGDTIELSKLYTTDFEMKHSMYETARLPKLINPRDRGYMEIKGGEYEIIGLYQAPEFIHDDYAISPNTVFLPASSISDMPEFPIRYSYTIEGFKFSDDNGSTILREVTITDTLQSPPDIYTVIINNGSIDDFKLAMEKIRPGYSDMFMYYDGGYSLAKSVYAAVENNVSWVLLAAAAVWAVVAALYLMLFVGKQKHEAGIMRSLGAGRKLVAGQIIVQGLAMMLIATLLCIAAGSLLYDSVIKITCEQALEQNGVSTAFSSLEGSAAEVARKLENAFAISKNNGIIVLTGAAQFSFIMLLTITSGVALSKSNILSLLRKRG